MLDCSSQLSATTSTPQPEREEMKQIRRQALSQSGLIHYTCARYSQAQPLLERAVQLTSLTYRLVTASSPAHLQQREERQKEDAELFALLARCYLKLRELEDAELAVTKATELLSGAKGSKQRLQELQVIRVQLLLGSTDPRRRQEAIALIERLIAEDDQHVPSLVVYACMAMKEGEQLPCIPYLLRAVVNLQQKKAAARVDLDTKRTAFELFASVVSLPGGTEALFAALGQAACIPSSLLFLAQTLKDQSAIDAAIVCYRRALQFTPQADVERAGIVLNLVHTLEVQMLYQPAWDELRAWMQTEMYRQHKQVGGVKLLDTVWQIVQGVVSVQGDELMLLGKAENCPAWRDIPPLV